MRVMRSRQGIRPETFLFDRLLHIQVKHDMLVIGLSSLPGGGKDYIADMLAENHGFYKISPGDIIRAKLISMKKGRMTREEQQELQDRLRKKYGRNYVMELCLKKIKASGKNRIAIAGIRFPEDVEFYKNKKGIRFYNVFVYAPAKVRFKRAVDRKRVDAPESYAAFLRSDKKEKDIFRLDATEKISDFRLDNRENNSRKLELEIERLMKEIGRTNSKK